MALSFRLLDAIMSDDVNGGQGTVDVTGLQEDELVVVYQVGDAGGLVAGDLQPPLGSSGWELRNTFEHVSEVITKVWTRLAGASEPSSYTFEYGDAEDGDLIAFAVSGTSGVPTFDISGVANGSSTSIGAPSVNIDNGSLSDITAAVLRVWVLYPRGSTGRSISEPGINILLNDLNDDNFNLFSAGWSHIADGASGSSTATGSHSHNWTGYTMSIIEIVDEQEPTEELVSASIDAVLLAEFDAVFDLDASLQAEFSTTYSIDALVTSTTFLDFDVDAVLQAGGVREFGLEAILFGTVSHEFSIDAFITNITEAEFRIDALLSTTNELEFELDGVLYRGRHFKITADLFLPSDTDLLFGKLSSRWYFGNIRV